MPRKLPPKQWVSKKVLSKSNLTEEEYRQLGRESQKETPKEMELTLKVNVPSQVEPKKKRGRPKKKE